MLTFILMAAKHGPGATKARKVNGTKKKPLEEQVKMIGLKKKKKKRFKQAEFPRIKDGQRFSNLYKTACTACGTGSE